jgi:hypothetical protein
VVTSENERGPAPEVVKITPVPEPSSATVLLGIAAFAACRRPSRQD